MRNFCECGASRPCGVMRRRGLRAAVVAVMVAAAWLPFPWRAAAQQRELPKLTKEQMYMDYDSLRMVLHKYWPHGEVQRLVTGYDAYGRIDDLRGAIDSLRQIVGYQKVALKDGKIVKQDPRINLDCSGVAKGYGSDCVANLLRRHGIENFMVEIGGEVVTSGINPDRVPWRIGVTKPVDDPTLQGGELQTVLNVTDKAMATSGNYRNFYYKGGKKYAHTIDPKTGYPVQHNILSSTVVADNCATADAYATAFMVMGLEKAKAILDKHPELMVYFIYSDKDGKNAVWFSPSMKKVITQ